MKFLYYLIEIPFIVMAVWLITNAHVENQAFSFELWPLDTIVQVNAKLTLCALILFGFIWAKINSWFAYSPIRRALYAQVKANKVLNKEQEKLNKTVDGLQKDIVGLQEKAKHQEELTINNNPQTEKSQTFLSFFARLFKK
mgnify:CR=1 FL=1